MSTPFGNEQPITDSLLNQIEQWILPVYKASDVSSLISDATEKEDKADDLCAIGDHEAAAALLNQAASDHDAAVSAYKRTGDGDKIGAHAREALRLRERAIICGNHHRDEGDLASRINKSFGVGAQIGHEFHGNQYTGGKGGHGDEAKRLFDSNRYHNERRDPLRRQQELRQYHSNQAEIHESAAQGEKDGHIANLHLLAAKAHREAMKQVAHISNSERGDYFDGGAAVARVRDLENRIAMARNERDGGNIWKRPAGVSTTRTHGWEGWVDNEGARLGKSVDFLDDSDDDLEIAKGGPGSGEHRGHPFRGNRWTSAASSAGHHNSRRGSENFDHGQHLDAAKAHIDKARTALDAGHLNEAGHHYKEAAYHAAKATDLIQSTSSEYPRVGTKQQNRELGEKAAALYEAAHTAENTARRASRAKGYATKARAGRLGADAIEHLEQRAQHLTEAARQSAVMAEGTHSQVHTARRMAIDPTLDRQAA